MVQNDFDAYALLDALRAGGDVDLVRTSVERSLEAQKRVWENGRIPNICTDHHFRLTERAHRSTDLVACREAPAL